MIAKCPACGAPATPGATVCRYCNSPMSAPPRPIHAPGNAAPRSAAPVGVAIMGIVVAGGVAGATFFSSMSRSPTTVMGPDGTAIAVAGAPRERPSDLLATVDAGDRDDLLVYFYADDKHRLARVDGVALTPKWISDQTVKSGLAAAVTDKSAIYVANGERLQAFELDGGRLRWEVGLAAEVQFDGNLRLVGDAPVAATKDGRIQAFDPAGGAVRWSRKITDTFYTQPTVAGKVVAEAEGDARKFVLVDPQTGAASPPYAIGCRNSSHNSLSDGYDDKQQVDATPDDKGLVFALGSFDPCIVHWDATTAAVKWTTDPKLRVNLGWHNRGGMLVDATGVYLGGDDAIVHMDLATGKLRDLQRDDEASFNLRFVHDGTLIAVRWPEYDSQKLSLVGIGPDGAQRWQHKLLDTDREGNDWAAVPAPGAVYVWQTNEDTKDVTVERVDLKTGQVTDRKPMTPTSSSTAPHIFGQIWTARRGWILASGEFATVDLTTGAVDHI